MSFLGGQFGVFLRLSQTSLGSLVFAIGLGAVSYLDRLVLQLTVTGFMANGWVTTRFYRLVKRWDYHQLQQSYHALDRG